MLDRDFAWQVGSIPPFWTWIILTIYFAIGLARDARKSRIDRHGAVLGWVCVGSCVTNVALSFFFPGPNASEWLRVLAYFPPLVLAVPFLTVACFRRTLHWSLRLYAAGSLLCVISLMALYIGGQQP